MQVQIIETCGDLIGGPALFFRKCLWREGRNASDRGSARVMEVNTATARRKLRSHEESSQRGALEQWR